MSFGAVQVPQWSFVLSSRRFHASNGPYVKLGRSPGPGRHEGIRLPPVSSWGAVRSAMQLSLELRAPNFHTRILLPSRRLRGDQRVGQSQRPERQAMQAP
jgi:hypothetical protein